MRGVDEMKYQISKESYEYFKAIEKKRKVKLKNVLLLQVAELEGKYVIFHVTEAFQEEGIQCMTADIKNTFNTNAEARMYVRNMKRDFELKTGIRPI